MCRISCLFAYAALWLTASQLRADEAADERVRFLIECLDRRIPVIDKDQVSLQVLLDRSFGVADDSGTKNDPKKHPSIVVNSGAFEKDDPMFDFERRQIHFETKLTNVRLDAVLNMTCAQLGAVFFVRSDSIEILPRSKACEELELKLTDEQPMPRLVYRIFAKVPLEKALEQIAERYNQNIVIAPQADDKKSTPVTARLVNVPVDVAVETLAELAHLKVVHKLNVFYVTTKKQAAELNAEQTKRK
jgi:hypothetical protein